MQTRGRSAAFDVFVATTDQDLFKDGLDGYTASMQGRANVKDDKYLARCTNDGIAFYPLGFGTGGQMGKPVSNLVKRIQEYGGNSHAWATSSERTWLTPSLSSWLYARVTSALRLGLATEADKLFNRSRTGPDYRAKSSTSVAAVQYRQDLHDRSIVQ